MNKARLLCAVVGAIAWAMSPGGAMAQDATPPTLVEFAFVPATVDASTGPASVTVTARLTDDLAGYSGGYAQFRSPSGQQYRLVSIGERTSENALDGEYVSTLVIPQFSEGGTWHLQYMYLSDRVGNGHDYWEADLVGLDLPTELVVIVNAPPVAQAGPNRGAIAAELLSFDGTASSDPDGTIAGYAWGFGDGTTASGPTVTHAYAAAGTFVVTLTVTDDDGATANDTATVIVQAPAEAIRSLSALVSSYNLKQGIGGALDEKLQNLVAALEAANAGQREDAANKLGAFINAVEAQRGKALTDAQADELIAMARRILTVLD